MSNEVDHTGLFEANKRCKAKLERLQEANRRLQETNRRLNRREGIMQTIEQVARSTVAIIRQTDLPPFNPNAERSLEQDMRHTILWQHYQIEELQNRVAAMEGNLDYADSVIARQRRVFAQWRETLKILTDGADLAADPGAGWYRRQMKRVAPELKDAINCAMRNAVDAFGDKQAAEAAGGEE